MFGYIRPLRGELKVCEFERFKACYCGLCHALGAKYGFIARFVLNFELVFLAMLLWDGEAEIAHKRCIASPCRKKACCKRNAALDICAGYCVILSWYRLRDAIADEPPIKALPYRLAALFLRGAYRKAARELPDFDRAARAKLRALAEIEATGVTSIDSSADKFALILADAVPDTLNDAKMRPLNELLYHTGRWIYILDAYDDYKQDVLAGRYNPIAAKYPPEGGAIPDEAVERLKTTLTHSNKLLCSAFELLPESAWTGTVENIIYLGMPDVFTRVINGTWKRPKRRNTEREVK